MTATGQELPRATFANRLALRVVQCGAIAAVLAVTTFRAFELDRFFAPKELVLHATAVLAGLVAWQALRRLSLTRVDLLLLGYLALGALSALLATNRRLALRALAISASALLLFWIARGLREAGLGRALLQGLALAVVLVAVTSLLQTYGVHLDLFSENRAPGGTLGNRNFIAHVAAFGFPLVLLAAVRGSRIASLGVALVVASLVLTRSRAAWLAFAVVALVLIVGLLASRPLRGDAGLRKQLGKIAFFAACATGAAMLLPNTLHWRSDDPYLDTVRHVADYQQGSGHGRLVQYANSLPMAAHHVLLGAGPGNWAVEYPANMPRNDPSMSDSEPGMTFNPWPSSDWIAFLSERGPVATLLLLVALASIALRGLRQLLAARDSESALSALVLLGTVAGAVVTGAFDAVLLIALPSLLIWTTLGALWVPDPGPRPLPILAILALLALATTGAIASARQLAAMRIYVQHSDRASLERAATIDPGNYRLQMRLAHMGRRSQRCEHALAARDLYPHAEAAIAASRGCR
jgi:O-antigen ligase